MKKTYNKKEYRLNEETIKNLAISKRQSGLSYNLFFIEMLKVYNNLKNMNKEQKARFSKITDVKEGDVCPLCKIGAMTVRKGKYGQFLACDNYPHCAFTRQIKNEN